MSSSTQITSGSLTTAAVIGSLVLVAVIVATLACICPRSSHQRPAHKARGNGSDIESDNNRQHVPYSEDSLPQCGFKNIFGRRSLIGSNDILDSLRISPSNPAIFGEGRSVTVSVKVTPPTPLRNGNVSRPNTGNASTR